MEVITPEMSKLQRGMDFACIIGVASCTCEYKHNIREHNASCNNYVKIQVIKGMVFSKIYNTKCVCDLVKHNRLIDILYF